MQQLGAVLFGIILVFATAGGLIAVGWFIAEIILGMPGLAIDHHVQRLMGWEAYITPPIQRGTTQLIESNGSSHDWSAVASSSAKLVTDNRIHIEAVMDASAQAAKIVARVKHEQAIERLRTNRASKAEFRSLRAVQLCPSCQKPRRIFHSASRECVKCVANGVPAVHLTTGGVPIAQIPTA